MSLFLDDTGRTLRSGWVVAIFSVVAAGTFGICNAVIGLLRLYPRIPLSLDDGYLFFNSTAMVIAAGVPSLICALVLRADLGAPLRRLARDLPLGVFIGAGLVSCAVLIPVAAGQGTLNRFDEAGARVLQSGLQQLFTLGPTAVGEELMLRGVILRQLAAGTRPWIAVALTGVTFGLMHLLNPDASAIAAVNVALVGVAFGVLALRTSLWASIGAHVAWNWLEGFFYGQPVSGIRSGHALFLGAVHDRGFFFGGEFGPEASGLTTVVLVLATLVAALWPRRPLVTPAPAP